VEVLEEIERAVKDSDLARIKIVQNVGRQSSHALDIGALIDHSRQQEHPEECFAPRNATVPRVEVSSNHLSSTVEVAGQRGNALKDRLGWVIAAQLRNDAQYIECLLELFGRVHRALSSTKLA
jgi:hypothetical protein